MKKRRQSHDCHAAPRTLVPFTPLTEVEKAVTAIDFESMARKAVEESMDRHRGRV